MKRSPDDYKHIRALGIMTLKKEHIIKDMQMLACKENAPINSLYRGYDGKWITTDDTKDSVLVNKINSYIS